jgi:hypothetical protein
MAHLSSFGPVSVVTAQPTLSRAFKTQIEPMYNRKYINTHTKKKI